MFNWSDIAERLLWTAVQAFVGVFAVAQIGDVESLKAAAVAGATAAVSAALSFVKNVIAQYIESRQA